MYCASTVYAIQNVLVLLRPQKGPKAEFNSGYFASVPRSQKRNAAGRRILCGKKIRKKWKRSEKNNMKEKKGLVVNFIYFRLRWRILPRYWSLNDRLLNEWSAQQHTYGRARGLGWSCCIGERIRSRGAEDKNEAGKSSPNNRNVSLN